MTPGLSKAFGVMYDHTFYKLANQQIRHQATHRVGCQPIDFAYIWSLQSSSGNCVGIYGLTYSVSFQDLQDLQDILFVLSCVQLHIFRTIHTYIKLNTHI